MTSTFEDHPHPATIQIPTGEANGAKLSVLATVVGMEGKRLILESPERISMSTPVSVEYNDAMFLGEVMICRAMEAGLFRVEIFVEQILTGLQSLMKLRDGLLAGTEPQKVPERAMVPLKRPAHNQN